MKKKVPWMDPSFVDERSQTSGHALVPPPSFWNSRKGCRNVFSNVPPSSCGPSTPGGTPAFGRRRPPPPPQFHHCKIAKFLQKREREKANFAYLQDKTQRFFFSLRCGGGRANVRERQRHSKHHEKGPGVKSWVKQLQEERKQAWKAEVINGFSKIRERH